MKDSLLEELELDPTFVRQRRLMLVTFIVRMFLLGVEYSVILPSVWLYVQKFKMESWFMGLLVALYPFSAMLSLPVVGVLYDRARRTKEIIVGLNCFQIVGNVLYAIPLSKWLPLSGRFIAGLGEGFFACVYGEISILYQEKYRTGMLSLLELGRVLGLILGPTLNFFIAKADFHILKWRLDNTTLPGVVLAIGWILHSFLTILCLNNLAKTVMEKQDESEKVTIANDGKTKLLSDYCIDNSNVTLGDSLNEEKKEIPTKHSYRGSITEAQVPNHAAALKNLLVFEFIVLFFVDAVLWFGQTMFELWLPLITETAYGWKQQSVGLVYMVGGTELIIVFLAMYFCCHIYSVADSHMIVLSLVFTFIAMSLMILEGYLVKLLHRELVFGMVCVLVFASIPLNLVAAKALLTKIVEPEHQGTVQGAFASVTRIALVIAPLVGSIAFYHRIVTSIVMAIFCLFGGTGMVLSLSRFEKRQEQVRKQRGMMVEED